MKTTILAIAMAMIPGAIWAAPARVTPQDALSAAKEAFDDYNPSLARKHIEECRKAMKRTRKTALTEAADSLEERVDRLESMMQRVEQIVVIDSITVDKEAFFETYRLSPSAGGLYSPATLPEEFDVADNTVVYMPENGQSIIWGSNSGLMESVRFTDGTWDTPTPAGEILDQGGTANFPFALTDGITLYYATQGDDSMGGYDIYISRRNDNGDFLTPQNMGMPYNSPYDDYMLAIDENSGLGWWATDRNRIPDSLTVYVFVPAQMRVNVEVSDPNLARLARLSDISLTRNEGVDYDAMLRQRLPKASPADTEAGSVFSIDIAGKVYTTLADFSNPDAKSAMAEYLAADAALRRLTSSLDGLRWKYAAGDRSVGHDIIEGEAEQVRLRKRMQTLRNSAVRMETKTR